MKRIRNYVQFNKKFIFVEIGVYNVGSLKIWKNFFQKVESVDIKKNVGYFMGYMFYKNGVLWKCYDDKSK